MKLTFEKVKRDLASLPQGYKTANVDGLIRKYVKERADTSLLRPFILEHQDLHRIYYYVPLKQMKNVNDRMSFIHENLLFEDWWHTDQLINYVADLDFDVAIQYAREYIVSPDPFIRRWGYVLFISRLGRNRAERILSLTHNDEHYYVQMAEAWLIAELAIFEPEYVFNWLKECDLYYNITGKAIQKIRDSFRIDDEWKQKFKFLRPVLREKTEKK